jgi:hypothetical protein
MSDYLPDDDVLHVTTINRNASTKSYVNIISYEGDFVPFTTTEADTLTQFFTDWNNIRTGVKSYIIDKQYQELVHRDNYVKKLCDMQTVAAAIEHCNYEYGPAPMMFLCCHGSKRTSNHPAFLKFGEERHVDDGQTRYVWAGSNDRDSPEDAVFLSQLIDKSGVVFLMCCNGDQIVEDYVSEMSEGMELHKIRDILFFNHENVFVGSPSIFMTLFMNLIDSDNRIRRDPYPNELYMAAKDAIITILQFLPGNPAHTDCTILGMHSIHVLDTAAWIQELLAVVRTHPAFQHPLAGPYAYDAEDPAWAAYVVLLDFGLRPVLSSSIPTPPTVPPMRHWIHYAEWEYRQVGNIEHQDHLRNLARLRAAALAPEAAEAGAALRDT